MLACARQELAHALRCEAQRYERRSDIRHLAIFGYQAVTKLHHRDTLEADSFAASLRQGRNIAECITRVERSAVAHGLVKVPAEIAGCPIELVVDHRRDPGAAFEGAVEHVVIDTICCEKLSEAGAIGALQHRRNHAE
jgi:hypothetical protein